MNLIKRLLKVGVALAVVGAVSLFALDRYETAQREQLREAKRLEAQKPLGLYTNATNWQWLREVDFRARESTDLQWRISSDNEYLMRRVYDNHFVMAQIAQDEDLNMTLSAQAYWPVNCEPGSEVTTRVLDGNGDSFKLYCDRAAWGTYLSVGAIYRNIDMSKLPHWSRDFDGFKVDENLGRHPWDFESAARHLTLNGLRPTYIVEREAEERRIAEEKAAEERRLAEEKAAEERRLAEEKAAEERRLAEEKAAEERRLAKEKAAEERRLAKEKAAEERRLAEEKAAQRAREIFAQRGWNCPFSQQEYDYHIKLALQQGDRGLYRAANDCYQASQ